MIALVLVCMICGSFSLLHTLPAFTRQHSLALSETVNSAASQSSRASLYFAPDREFIKDNLLEEMLEKQKRPAHVQIPRRRLELAFAVQLARTSYNVADWLNFTPMNLFQRDFFLFRQNEWDSYRKFHPNVLQGDLAQPEYFDFISFSQYATLSYSIVKSQKVFTEVSGPFGKERKIINEVIQRNPLLTSTETIVKVHSAAVGDSILDFILTTFPSSITPKVSLSNSTNSSPTKSGSVDSFLKDAQLILDVFQFCGFANQLSIEKVPSKRDGEIFVGIRSNVPATLWSQQALKNRNDVLINNFDIKTLKALARRCNLSLSDPVRTIISYGNVEFLNVCELSEQVDGDMIKLMRDIYSGSYAENKSIADGRGIKVIELNDRSVPPRIE